ncbi:hypothetical protein RHGRI_024031 [Rhododendron griersonianum]|uniref:Gnk2-homologous domain-containing protein n=1 Tax=Rhododendron griersonianum TaxID=479676 RepID=A0AAV6J7S9_9ERIC|nr:hypothetical protein RHGRI_024031 [Rhododendron griersonianum]
MSSLRFLSPLYLLSISLLFQLALATNPIDYECSATTISNPNGPYKKNFNKLLSYLNYTTPMTGFINGSVGLSPNQVYGLALCRGDINSTDCKACVSQTEIQQLCPSKVEAIIWYEYCLLRYSNLNFFGQVDFSEAFYYPYYNNVSDPAYFDGKVVELLDQLEGEAYVAPKLYASGALAIGNSTTIYGLVQCTS